MSEFKVSKLLLIGDSAVGKSSLLLRFTDNKFEETYRDTIGMDFRIKAVNLGSKVVKLQIWDTAGQERFRTVTSSYYRGASGIICCYSVTDRRSFLNVQKWLRDIEAYASEDVMKLLVGNKVDMSAARQVETSEGVSLARSVGIPFMETSAKSGVRVSDAFMLLASEIAKKDVEPEPLHDPIMLEDFSSLLPSKRKKCSCT